jgi:hypothetical protein
MSHGLSNHETHHANFDVWPVLGFHTMSNGMMYMEVGKNKWSGALPTVNNVGLTVLIEIAYNLGEAQNTIRLNSKILVINQDIMVVTTSLGAISGAKNVYGIVALTEPPSGDSGASLADSFGVPTPPVPKTDDKWMWVGILLLVLLVFFLIRRK